MIITEVNTYVVELSAVTMKIGSMPRFKASGLYINIKTDEGFEGWSVVHWALSSNALKVFIDEALRKIVLKKDPFMNEEIFWDLYKTSNRICFGIPQATAGLDNALWDLKGQATKTPIYKLLGGMKTKVRAYASFISGFTPKATAQTAGVAVDKGFSAVKIRIGTNPTKDEAVIKEVRDTFPDLIIMADVNSGYSSVRDALQLAKIAEKYNLRWIEEVLQSEDLEALARVRSKSNVDIAGGENDFGIYRFHDILSAGAYDIIQADVSRNGFTQMKKIEALATVRGIPVIPHIFGFGHQLAANLHFILASQSDWVEFAFAPEEFQLLEEPFHIKDGYLEAPDKPGLGVQLHPDALRQYRVQ
ncbi:MAG TPA: mandelate racemase/muconate lactonizing enzyme family protein [Candidatus Lokiarchaeia archaeon]|nr:mandelate racemase/muconate lactonizing enzyme family protein [Candidatus Lokiarchaeia archaeon]